MRRIKRIISVLLVMLFMLTACNKQDVKMVIEDGKYVSVDKSSYIVVSDYKNGKSDEYDEIIGYCNIQFFNVDLSAFEEYYLANNTANYIAVNTEGNVSDERLKEIQDMLMDNVDFRKQFIDNKAEFFYFKDSYGDYGLAGKVDGSGFGQGYETYVSIGYLPKEKTIIVDDVKYILEE